MKIDKLLAGTLAIVLIAGLGTPAFADSHITQSNSGPLSSTEIVSMQTAHNIVFDNGGLPVSNAGLTITDVQAGAEDFIIDTDTFITDFHFVSIRDPSGLEYRIFSDSGGLPSTTVLASGSAQNIVTSQIGTSDFWEVWFDLEDPDDPFLAEAGVLYWFSLHSTINNDGAFVQTTTGGFGSFTAHEFPLFSDSWTLRTSHAWFLLSGEPADEEQCPPGTTGTPPDCEPIVVGGEFLPIDSTALLLAGSQSFSWMIPVILSGIGIGLFVFRKSENS